MFVNPYISKRNRLKWNLFTLLVVNWIVSTLVNSELTKVNLNIRPWEWVSAFWVCLPLGVWDEKSSQRQIWMSIKTMTEEKGFGNYLLMLRGRRNLNRRETLTWIGPHKLLLESRMMHFFPYRDPGVFYFPVSLSCLFTQNCTQERTKILMLFVHKAFRI